MKECIFNKLVYIKTSKVMKNYEIQNMKIINEKIDHSSRRDNW